MSSPGTTSKGMISGLEQAHLVLGSGSMGKRLDSLTHGGRGVSFGQSFRIYYALNKGSWGLESMIHHRAW